MPDIKWKLYLTSNLQGRSQPFLTVLALLSVLLIWAADFLTGPELSISIFYLIPIGLASWYLSRGTGVIVSLLCAGALFIADAMTSPMRVEPIVPFWNAAVRLGSFLVVTYALSSLRVARERQQELTSFIIHDLQSPLAAIILTLTLLKDVLPGSSEEETAHKFVGMGQSAAEELQGMIHSMLDLARLESGRMPLQREVVAVGELLAQAVHQVTLLAQSKGVRLEVISPSGGLAIYVDWTVTVRVLTNLLGNAIKFSPSNSLVTISASATNGGVIISVSDQGPGIPDEWRQKVFHKFAQVQARKSGVPVGSGLGLTFCKTAIEAQGGRIWIESGSERGTIVQLWLPSAKGPTANL